METDLVFAIHRLCEVLQDRDRRNGRHMPPVELDATGDTVPDVAATQQRLAVAVEALLALCGDQREAVLEVEAAANAAIVAAIDATWAISTAGRR